MAKKQNFSIGGVRFEADVTEITKALNIMDEIPRHVLSNIAREVEIAARDELINTFVEAIDRQSEDSFPDEFRAHTIDIVAAAKFETHVSSTAFDISFDFSQLGDRKDLERAFHQGALLADGKTRLNGPYTGQPLHNPDASERHIFWEAVQRGLSSAPNPKRPGHIPIRPGAWEETKNKYVQIWGNKAPEWLYLQFGQNAWEPKIRSFPIIETFSRVLNEVAEQLFFNSVVQEIERAQSSGAVFTPYGARLTRATQELGPSGKPRRPGQFYPLH